MCRCVLGLRVIYNEEITVEFSSIDKYARDLFAIGVEPLCAFPLLRPAVQFNFIAQTSFSRNARCLINAS